MQTLPVIRSKKSHSSRKNNRKKIKSIHRMSVLPDIEKPQKPTAWLIGISDSSFAQATGIHQSSRNQPKAISRNTCRGLPAIGSEAMKRRSNSMNSESSFERRFSRTRSRTISNENIEPASFEENGNKYIRDRIKEFMTKDIPGKPPSTLRYTAPKQQKTSQENKLLTKQEIQTLPINTNSCPNLYLLADREKWSYNYRPGKCRYLRCPQSPVLQPEDIFSSK